MQPIQLCTKAIHPSWLSSSCQRLRAAVSELSGYRYLVLLCMYIPGYLFSGGRKGRGCPFSKKTLWAGRGGAAPSPLKRYRKLVSLAIQLAKQSCLYYRIIIRKCNHYDYNYNGSSTLSNTRYGI